MCRAPLVYKWGHLTKSSQPRAHYHLEADTGFGASFWDMDWKKNTDQEEFHGRADV